ncbi:hypothetical protein HQ520_02560 [bacterium]|nr:hypothetical protein [bacterium]
MSRYKLNQKPALALAIVLAVLLAIFATGAGIAGFEPGWEKRLDSTIHPCLSLPGKYKVTDGKGRTYEVADPVICQHRLPRPERLRTPGGHSR